MGSPRLRVERRANRRVGQTWPGTIARCTGESGQAVTTNDMSMAGMSVRGDFHGEPGERVVVVVLLPYSTVSIVADVVQSRDVGHPRSVVRETGLKFTRFVGLAESALAAQLNVDPEGSRRPGPAFLAELVTSPTGREPR